MNPDLDDVLQLVASGELSPAEALELLDDSPSSASSPSSPPIDAAPPPPATYAPPPPPLYGDLPHPLDRADRGGAVDTAPGARRDLQDAVGPIREVQLRTPYRAIHVIGDPTVSELLITGPHTVRRDGHAAVIENPADARSGDGGFSFSSLPWGLAFSKEARDKLIIRVNPTLLISGVLTANDLHISGCEGGVRIKTIAGAIKLDRVRGPFTIDASTSSVKGSVGILGDSIIRAEQSSVALSLLAGTDLRVHAHNRLGKVVLPAAVTKGGITDGETSDTVIGSGRDQLDIDALMSSVKVTVER